MAHVPILNAAANAKREVGQVLLPAGGVHYFQMELHRIETARGRRHGRHRASAGSPGDRETFGHPSHHIAMWWEGCPKVSLSPGEPALARWRPWRRPRAVSMRCSSIWK